MKKNSTNHFKNKRMQLGYTQEDIAEILDININQVKKYENSTDTKQKHNILHNFIKKHFLIFL